VDNATVVSAADDNPAYEKQESTPNQRPTVNAMERIAHLTKNEWHRFYLKPD